MMYLARKGSARIMKEPLEVGLYMLEDALKLSEHLQPCKDTGMVLYIFINIMLQMYEKTPTMDIKIKIIGKIDEAINVHFADGPSFLREDYTRMLHLKMAFCYLGIGLFGNIVEGCQVSGEDLKSARTCLNLIESGQAKLDNRRRMFYFTAKSVLFRKLGSPREALEMASLAKEKAEVCGYKKELEPIIELTGDLEQELTGMQADVIRTRELAVDSELESVAASRDDVLSRSAIERILKRPSNQWGGGNIGGLLEAKRPKME